MHGRRQRQVIFLVVLWTARSLYAAESVAGARSTFTAPPPLLPPRTNDWTSYTSNSYHYLPPLRSNTSNVHANYAANNTNFFGSAVYDLSENARGKRVVVVVRDKTVAAAGNDGRHGDDGCHSNGGIQCDSANGAGGGTQNRFSKGEKKVIVKNVSLLKDKKQGNEILGEHVVLLHAHNGTSNLPTPANDFELQFNDLSGLNIVTKVVDSLELKEKNEISEETYAKIKDVDDFAVEKLDEINENLLYNALEGRPLNQANTVDSFPFNGTKPYREVFLDHSDLSNWKDIIKDKKYSLPRNKAGNSNESFKTGHSNESLKTGQSNDSLKTGQSNDSLKTGHINESLKTGLSNDSLKTGHSNDSLKTGHNNDSLKTGHSNDSLKTGHSNDSHKTIPINDSLKTGLINDSLKTNHSNDPVRTGLSNDTLNTGHINKTLKTGNSNDHSKTGQSNDPVKPGHINDSLETDHSNYPPLDEHLLASIYDPLDLASLASSLTARVVVEPELPSKVTIETSKEVTSNEIHDLALKKWLKSSSQGVSSSEKEQRTIEELSYKILSQIDHEEESKDEINDKEIYKAVFASVAAYQIRKLRRKLRNGRVKRDEEMVCYKDLGCFRDDGAFDYLDVLPSPPEEINTKFLLFTRHNADEEQIFTIGNSSSIYGSHFDPAKQTKVIIHGFGSSCYRVWVREMRVALLTMVDVNLICVDWENGATVPNYMRAASNTRLVGRQVGLMIETLVEATNTSIDQFHLIGFSLGAHVSGHAGAKLKLKRISGLDPAGPMFENFPPAVRLDSSDAEFVDVIHTNADSLIWGGLGAYQAMGHVDFYPNGGRMQKGCANLFVGGVSDILWPTEGDGRSLCNHRRGYKYFVESIAPVCKFPAFVCPDHDTFLKGECFPCDGCGSMGYYSDRAVGRGKLYLVTRDSEPFCANQYKVSLKHSGGPPLLSAVSTYGRVEVSFIGADGINETIPLTRKPDEELQAGSTSVRILVPHPAITGIESVQLLYTAYDGWLSSGSKRWAIDKFALMDSFGTQHSFCQLGVTLESGVPMTLHLRPGDCMPHFTPWRQGGADKSPVGGASGQPPVNGPHHNASADGTPLGAGVDNNSLVLQNKPLDEAHKSKPSQLPESTITVNRPSVQTIPSAPGSSHASVIISFPNVQAPSAPTLGQPTNDKPSKTASSSFSISLPSSPVSPSNSPSDTTSTSTFSHHRYPWRPNTEDRPSSGTHFVVHGNNFTKYQFNNSNVMIVTSQPVHKQADANHSSHAMHEMANTNRTKVSNIRDGPAPNLYPASMTVPEDPTFDYHVAGSQETGPGKNVAGSISISDGLLNITNRNVSSNYQSHVVIKVNENNSNLWGLNVYQSHPLAVKDSFVSPTTNQQTINRASANEHFNHEDTLPNPISNPVRTNGHQGAMLEETATTTTTSNPIENNNTAKSTEKNTFDHKNEESALSSDKNLYESELNGNYPNAGTSSPDHFGYVLQDENTNGPTLLLLGKPDSSHSPDVNPLAPFLSNSNSNRAGFNNDLSNIGVISYNSLVDGEVPINERARALFGKVSDKNSVITAQGSDAKEQEKAHERVSQINFGQSEMPKPPPLIGGRARLASEPTTQVIGPEGSANVNNNPAQTSSVNGRTPVFYSHRSRLDPQAGTDAPYLSLSLRPPAPMVPFYHSGVRNPTSPFGASDSSGPRFNSQHPHHQQQVGTFTRQSTQVIPQIFADQLASLSMEEPASAFRIQPGDGTNPNPSFDNNKPLNSFPQSVPNLHGPQYSTIRPRVRGSKVHTPSPTTTTEPSTTESPLSYSWGYFFGRRSSEETGTDDLKSVGSNDDADDKRVERTAKHEQSELQNTQLVQPNAEWQLHLASQRHFQLQQLGKHRSGKLIQDANVALSHQSHGTLQETPTENQNLQRSQQFTIQEPQQQPHPSDNHSNLQFKHQMQHSQSEQTRNQIPGPLDLQGNRENIQHSNTGRRTANPKMTKQNNGRSTNLSGGRRSNPAYRFHPRMLTAPGNFRRLPANPKHPIYAKLPPNFPFHQLNPFTALPTRLIAPPPPSESESGDKDNSPHSNQQKYPQPQQLTSEPSHFVSAQNPKNGVTITESREHDRQNVQGSGKYQQPVIVNPSAALNSTLNTNNYEQNTSIRLDRSKASGDQTEDDIRKQSPLLPQSTTTPHSITHKNYTSVKSSENSQVSDTRHSNLKFRELSDLSQPILDILHQQYSSSIISGPNQPDKEGRQGKSVQDSSSSVLHSPISSVNSFQPSDTSRLSTAVTQQQSFDRGFIQPIVSHERLSHLVPQPQPSQTSIHPSTTDQQSSVYLEQAPRHNGPVNILDGPYENGHHGFVDVSHQPSLNVNQAISSDASHQYSSYSAFSQHAYNEPSVNPSFSHSQSSKPSLSYKSFLSSPADTGSSELNPVLHSGYKSYSPIQTSLPDYYSSHLSYIEQAPSNSPLHSQSHQNSYFSDLTRPQPPSNPPSSDHSPSHHQFTNHNPLPTNTYYTGLDSNSKSSRHHSSSSQQLPLVQGFGKEGREGASRASGRSVVSVPFELPTSISRGHRTNYRPT